PFSGDGEDWAAGLVLRWNLFAGFGRSAAVRRADAARAIARTRYEAALREARAGIAAAREAVTAARQASRAAAVANEAAGLGRDLMRRRFEEGLATAMDLLAAEARAVLARSRAIDAEADRLVAEARLRYVTTIHVSE
ncbi:MAG: TolC family protein, partial [Gemmatimonadota bacterium]|nr:TolC family protein [Gemmatimonadota bacterium]